MTIPGDPSRGPRPPRPPAGRGGGPHRLGAAAGPTTDHGDTFLFSPSASYPRPFACLIDRTAALVHAWSTALDQPDPATAPPAYLRGWNHVELDAEANLYAMVPLHALLKLRPDSSLAWRLRLPVHHDLDITRSGEVYVLTEEARLIPWRGGTHVLLDNTVTLLGRGGEVRAAHSLYDILTSQPALAELITAAIARRRARTPPIAASTLGLGAAQDRRRGRDISRRLREVPGAPSDILHANTIEILPAHPRGLWDAGDVVVSLRNLNLIAVLDLAEQSVRWFWGPGQLSGQHQPSLLADGTLLVFDNGHAAGRSRLLEIDPCSRRIVWQLAGDPPESLFCAMAGGCQRLPGGTILISDAQAGRALEVDRGGRTLWSVHIHTAPTHGAPSRAQFYRMSAVPAATAALLSHHAAPARHRAASQLRCELNGTLPHLRSTP